MFFLLLFCFIFCKNSKLAPFLQKEFTYYNIGISLKQNENTLSAMAARIFDTVERDNGQYDYQQEILWAFGM